MAMLFPAGKVLYVVLEPGNVKRMKDLSPIQIVIPPGVTTLAVVVTPDMEAFEQEIIPRMPCTPEMLQKTLVACKDRPEVLR